MYIEKSTVPPAQQAAVLWFIPTHGDGRYLGTFIGARQDSLLRPRWWAALQASIAS